MTTCLGGHWTVMLRWLNPFRIRDAVRNLKRIREGGGPKVVRLTGIGQPEGLIVPTSEICLEVETVKGTTIELKPMVPIPFPYAWAYRAARSLGVPLVSTMKPENLRVDLPVPGR